MKCPKVQPHEPHWHVVMAGNITVAGGMCMGEGREESAP